MRYYREKLGSACSLCPLRDQVRVPGKGPSGPIPLVMIGESPGREEEIGKEPFVGPAGRLLNKALYSAGIRRSLCHLTNLISCRPPGNKLSSPEGNEALGRCRKGLEAELDALIARGAKCILTLGGEPFEALTGTGSITRYRGGVYFYKDIPLVPTYHPSWILRGMWKEEPTWIADLEKAWEIAQGGYVPPKENFNLFPSLADIEAFAKKAKGKLVAVDIETTSLREDYADIVVIGLSLDGESGISFPFYSQGGKRYWKNGDQGRALAALRSILANKTVFQNSLFDVPHLFAHGFDVPYIAEDTLFAHHAIHPELPHNIGYIVSIYGKTPYWKEEFKNRGEKILEMDDTELRTYNLRDSVVLHQVLPGLHADLEEMGTMDLYRNVSMKLLGPVMEMTRNGLPLNKPALRAYARKLKKKLAEVNDMLRMAAELPDTFNLDSPDHMRLLVYGVKEGQFTRAMEDIKVYQDPECKLRKDTKKYAGIREKVEMLSQVRPLTIPRGYRTRSRTSTGRFSIDEEALLNLAIAVNNRLQLTLKFVRKTEEVMAEIQGLTRSIKVLSLFRTYQELSKLVSTYTSYPTWRDGYVHPRYLIHGTRTGRLSSRDPNAQNIPKDSRKVFKAPEGWSFIEADYSNLELRVLAFESNDDVLINTFLKGENVHDTNTRDLFGIEPDNPLWDLARRAAKIYIFGRNYGGGLSGIYQRVAKEVPELGLTMEHFREIDESYRKRHPRYASWYRRTEQEILRERKLNNAFGRLRIFLGTDAEVVREGLNFPIQSAAADIINAATIRIFGRKPPDLKMVGQIHDALLFLVEDGKIHEAVALIRQEMQRAVDFREHHVSFPVDIKVGKTWGGMREYKEAKAKAG